MTDTHEPPKLRLKFDPKAKAREARAAIKAAARALSGVPSDRQKRKDAAKKRLVTGGKQRDGGRLFPMGAKRRAMAKSIEFPTETADEVTFPLLPHEKLEPHDPAKVRRGRRSGYTQELAQHITRLMMQGYSARMVSCMEGMPDSDTISAWAIDHPEFAMAIMKARAYRAQHMADEIIDIADNSTNDYMEVHSKWGGQEFRGWRENGEAVRRSALRVDVRKFLMSKLYPRLYGDSIKFEMTPIDLKGLDKDATETLVLLLDKLTPKKEQS